MTFLLNVLFVQGVLENYCENIIEKFSIMAASQCCNRCYLHIKPQLNWTYIYQSCHISASLGMKRNSVALKITIVYFHALEFPTSINSWSFWYKILANAIPISGNSKACKSVHVQNTIYYKIFSHVSRISPFCDDKYIFSYSKLIKH